VPRDAGQEQIKKAFRRVARETHPDANPSDPTSAERFKEAAEAYEVLSDPGRRRRYDRGDTIDLSDLLGGMGGFDDLIRSVFGNGGIFGTRPSQPSRGRDILIRASISLETAAFGGETTVSYHSSVRCEVCDGTGAEPGTAPQTCPECGGSGSVRMAQRSLFGTMMTLSTCRHCGGEGVVIDDPCSNCAGAGAVQGETTVTVEVPAGVSTGTRLRLGRRGEAAGRGGVAGDLYVEILVEADPRFERIEANLVHRVTIGIAEAALGTVLQVPLVEGGEIDVEVPPGTQPGSTITVRGHGMTLMGRRGRGDLVVVVEVEIPSTITEEEEELLRRWAEMRGERIGRPASTS
jgi:molecular chaperone DnaJ